MLRHRVATASDVPVRLVYSSRSLDEVIYREDLARLGAHAGVEVVHTLTRERPAAWTGYARRVDRQLLAEQAWPASAAALAYVCGPTRFVETVARSLLQLGYNPDTIRTERFGPTGR